MSFNKKFFATGGIVASSDAVCTTETTDKFGDGNGVALYSLDYDASDTSGNYDGTASNVTFGVGGQINYGARFNGSSSKITLSNTSSWGINDVITTSIWAKTTATSGTLFSVGVTGLSNNYAWFVMNMQSDGKVACGYTWNDGGFKNAKKSSLTINDGNWHLITFVASADYSNGGGTLYIDGVEDTSATTLNTTSGSQNTIQGGATIGEYSARDIAAFNGDLDQVRIFSSALTSDQVEDLYEETACVHTATTTDNDYPVTNAAYYKFDNSAEDSKGTADGSETDIEYRFGRYGQAAVFNGSSSKINIGNQSFFIGNNDYTLSMWFNPKNTSGTSAEVLVMERGSSSYLSPIELWLRQPNNSSNAQKLQFGIGGSGTTITYIYSSNTYTVNNWNFVAVKISGTTMSITLNGTETTGTYSGTRPTISNSIRFGNDYLANQNDFPFEGYLDQIRIFSSALTPSQVSQLYNEKPETDTSNFKTVLYEGTGSTQYISNVGMDLETNGGLVWIKNRDSAYNHYLYDSIRGAKNILASDSTIANTVQTNGLSSFEANGFFLEGNRLNVNENNSDIVAWVWKGGGDAVTDNTTGDLTADISANTEAGFSIVNFTGVTATPDGVTVPHGLNSAPELVILKPINVSGSWVVYAYPVGNNKFLKLDDDAEATTTTGWDNTHPDSNNVTMEWSSTSKEYIMYCWHSVAGYSKIGTYAGGSTGSGNAISCGFQPSWLMVKCYDSTGGAWRILDQRRGDDSTNGNVDDHLVADGNNVESTDAGTTWEVVFTSDGFYFTGTGTTLNGSGRNFLFMAFK